MFTLTGKMLTAGIDDGWANDGLNEADELERQHNAMINEALREK